MMHAVLNETTIALLVLSLPLVAALLPDLGVWPSDWPLWGQLAVAILVADRHHPHPLRQPPYPGSLAAACRPSFRSTDVWLQWAAQTSAPSGVRTNGGGRAACAPGPAFGHRLAFGVRSGAPADPPAFQRRYEDRTADPCLGSRSGSPTPSSSVPGRRGRKLRPVHQRLGSSLGHVPVRSRHATSGPDRRLRSARLSEAIFPTTR